MADGYELSSSPKDGKFTLDIIDVTAVESLKEKAYLVYDGNRIQWNQEFNQLRTSCHKIISFAWKESGNRLAGEPNLSMV